MVQERRVPYSQAIGLSMVKLNSQPDHHWNEQQIGVKDGLTVIRGQHSQKQHLPGAYQMGGRVKG